MQNVIPSLAAGIVISAGALLVVTGAGKVYASVRRVDGASAVRRMLRMRPGTWRFAYGSVGAAECATGGAACAGLAPLLSGTAMTIMGTAFVCLLLGVRHARVAGGCECLGWSQDETTVTWRSLARAAWILGAGVLSLTAQPGPPGPVDWIWRGAGAAGAATALALLTSRLPTRTPLCHRRLWYPTRATLRALRQHAVFESMARSVGPLSDHFVHRRTGCLDEFWFAAAPGKRPENDLVVFRVRHIQRYGSLAVQATISNTAPSKTPSGLDFPPSKWQKAWRTALTPEHATTAPASPRTQTGGLPMQRDTPPPRLNRWHVSRTGLLPSATWEEEPCAADEHIGFTSPQH